MNVATNLSDHHEDIHRTCAYFLIMVCGLLMSLPPMAEAGNPEVGKQIYEQSCEHCHGHAGDGQGQMAEYLTPPPAKLAGEPTQSKTDVELQDIILKGRAGTAMAGFEGAINATQMTDLLAYLRSLKS